MSAPASTANNDQVVVLLLADIAQASRLWGWSRIVKGPQALQDIPGLLFSKVLGSGYEGGLDLDPALHAKVCLACLSLCKQPKTSLKTPVCCKPTKSGPTSYVGLF